MAMLSNLDLIRRVPLFSLLTADQAQSIADSVVKRRFKRGELIVEQGTKSNALFILLNGRARVLTADSRGREVILAVLQPGDYVGEMSLIDNEPHSATVRAEVQTDMLVLGRADFARGLPEPSSLAYGILRGLVARLRKLLGIEIEPGLVFDHPTVAELAAALRAGPWDTSGFERLAATDWQTSETAGPQTATSETAASETATPSP
ncbi:cyclic nucleotide-binding domain-containing protein [Mitsuaria sp. TWR114]|uniref:cyclic nucleotide-binding domain-containing protein n=1 Tax=Mitsuaria sp. TWR114 TaxID=2601731 RepID=UPI0011BE68F1|nr:cyclic nucleotide-binding domain-containing protein [Mitsuaria sp. TWR114]TXD94451.1 cyclic nucleotide-binding domain-containing protein [Mitsuaria sp. TWR114]